tara:strand:+ start:1072 stop:1728 length:657 start_codon:yes stop_codon:yes gene_type:complete
MRTEATQKRVELKFQVKPVNISSVMNQIFSSEYIIIPHHNKRLVNSIYFDSSNLSELENSIEGLYKKKKLRYRFYGNISEIKSQINGQWELKKKQGIVTEKIVHKEVVDFDKIFSPNLSTFRSTNNSINYEINTYPYLSKFISYEREYFVSKLFGDDLRVTIDKNILSKEFINNNLKRTKRLDTNIVELKIKYKLYEDVSFQNMNFLTRVGFSKYSEA